MTRYREVKRAPSADEILAVGLVREALRDAADRITARGTSSVMQAVHTLRALAHAAGLERLETMARDVETAHEDGRSVAAALVELKSFTRDLVRVAEQVSDEHDDRRIGDLLTDATTALAEHLGKRAGIAFHISARLGSADSALLAAVAVHLLRNAMDHGLEDERQRLARGKPAVGRIELTVERVRDVIFARFADDGGGIGSRAADGSAGGLSGRGLGLAAVRSALAHAGGELRLERTGPDGTAFVFSWIPSDVLADEVGRSGVTAA